MLTDGDLVAMRGVLGDTLAGTAVIERKTSTSDGQGGQTEGWTPAGTVACRLAPRMVGNDESELGSRTAGVTSWVLTTPAGTDLRAADRAVVDSATYEVVAVRGPRTVEISRRADVVKID